jgi:hypothetical protein
MSEDPLVVALERLRKLIADLDSPDFATRQAASHELAGLSERAVPALQAAQRSQLSPEAARRIDQLLGKQLIALSPETARVVRAVDALERRHARGR